MNAAEIIEAHSAICQRCRHCVRECPVKAVRVTETILEVDSERCLHCGSCVSACSQSALSGRSDLSVVQRLIDRTPTVAIVSPEAMSVWPHISWAGWERALTTLGFHSVENGWIGEHLISRAYDVLGTAEAGGPLIRSSCPAVVRYVEQFKSELVGFLAPLVTPGVAQTRLIAELYPESPPVVAITPCLAMKAVTGVREEGPVAAITPEELLALLGDGQNDFTAPHGSADPDNVGVRSFSGGSAALVNDRTVVTAVGFSEIIRVLLSLRTNENTQLLYDLRACGRCVSGIVKNSGATEIGASLASLSEETVRRLAFLFPPAGYKARPVTEEKVDRAQLESVLCAAGLGKHEWQLDCTICGYATCTDHARAVIKGYSDWSACLPSQTRLFATTAAELRDSGLIDGPTALLNRNGILAVVEREAKRVRRYGGILSILALEVESFSALVDRYGSRAADRLLVLLAQLITGSVREVDTCGRCGGNRFVVVLPKADERASQTVAQNLRKKIGATVFWLNEDEGARLTVRTGLIQVDESETDPAVSLTQVEEMLRVGRVADSLGSPEA